MFTKCVPDRFLLSEKIWASIVTKRNLSFAKLAFWQNRSDKNWLSFLYFCTKNNNLTKEEQTNALRGEKYSDTCKIIFPDSDISTMKGMFSSCKKTVEEETTYHKLSRLGSPQFLFIGKK